MPATTSKTANSWSAIGKAIGHDAPVSPERLIALAESDPAFHKIKARFSDANIQNWLTEREKALHFGAGAFAAGNGTTVELGTFEGGAAMFLAAGTQRRGSGRVVCVDPHFGGPPWLGMGPQQRTLDKFLSHAEHCGVSGCIEPRIGDSAAVAAVWPGEQIDVVFIDGDHSYVGALKDFECWATKVRTGGLVMIDDADDASLPELLQLISEIKTLSGVTFCGQIDGVAVFQREATSANELLDEVKRITEKSGLHRPWDLRSLHQFRLPESFRRTFVNSGEPGAGDAYQLAFLARCGTGAYGYTAAAADQGISLVKSVSADRGDGPVIELKDKEKIPCRAIFCGVDEQGMYASHLMPGGVMLTYNQSKLTQDSALEVRQKMLNAGLEGCGWVGAYHWGVWQPFALSAEAIVNFAVAGFRAA